MDINWNLTLSEWELNFTTIEKDLHSCPCAMSCFGGKSMIEANA